MCVFWLHFCCFLLYKDFSFKLYFVLILGLLNFLQKQEKVIFIMTPSLFHHEFYCILVVIFFSLSKSVCTSFFANFCPQDFMECFFFAKPITSFFVGAIEEGCCSWDIILPTKTRCQGVK